jgi:hypothetical protein
VQSGALLLTDGALSDAEDIHYQLRRIDAFNCSSIWDASASAPPLAVVARYGVVLVATDTPADPSALATVLAEYIQIGGGVVFAGYNSSIALRPFFNTSLVPFVSSGATLPAPTTTPSLSANQSNAAILSGVASFEGPRNFTYVNVTLAANATVLATMTVGNSTVPLVVSLPAPQAGGGRVAGIYVDAESSDGPLFHPTAPQCADTGARYWYMCSWSRDGAKF